MKEGKYIVLLILLVIVIQLVFGNAIYWLLPGWTERGTFGDMFGAVNTLFSGLAFAGVIYAIVLQQRELKLQREELELTRNELSRTADAQEKSEKALQAQVKAAELSARLTAINHLLERNDLELRNLTIWTSGSPEEARAKKEEEKRRILLTVLEEVYQETIVKPKIQPNKPLHPTATDAIAPSASGER